MNKPRYSVPRGGYAIRQLWKYNDSRVEGDVAYLKLRHHKTGKSYEAIIDAEDLESALKSAHWGVQLNPEKQLIYARGVARGRGVPGVRRQPTYFLHRFVMDAPQGMAVDHINGDSLDCRKKNLRIVTIGENSRNIKVRRMMVCPDCRICDFHKREI